MRHETPHPPALTSTWMRACAPLIANPNPHTPMPSHKPSPTTHPDGGRGVGRDARPICEEPARRLAVSTDRENF